MPRLADLLRVNDAGLQALLADWLHGCFTAPSLEEAMAHYDAAAAIRPAGNDDALLRWNTCARMMNSAGVAERDHGDERFLE